MNFPIEEIEIYPFRMNGPVITHEGERFQAPLRNIRFESKGFPFQLRIYQIENEWFPAYIRHLNGDKNACPYCDERFSELDCPLLNQYLDSVFETVMNHPKLKLKKFFF